MKKLILVVSVILTLAALAPPAEARGIIRLGFNFGIPIYPGPWCGPAYYPYYRPYPVYVAPAPVYYAPPPVVYQAAPAPVYQPVYQPVPVVRAQSSSASGYAVEQAPPPQTVEPRLASNNRDVQQLFSQDDFTRADTAIELGRAKSQQAIDPLCTLLTTDRSPQVRDAAARALGLIGNARALSALQNAAQADGDRDVRRSAQFAAEVIRANVPR